MNHTGVIQLPYTDSSTTKSEFRLIGWIKDSFGEIISTAEIDNLSFMGTFRFPKIEIMRLSLKRSGDYTEEQIEEIITGLKTLPEYRE